MDKKDIENIIWIAGLENAMKFGGEPKRGAIIGKLFSKDPELKKNMNELSPLISDIIKKISAMSREEQEKKILELSPDFYDKEKEKRVKRKKQARELPPLKDAEEGRVVTRIPPGPSKYPHIGHAVSFGINYLYAENYQGSCILRFDDTNPEVDGQEYVDAMKEDVIGYLGMEPEKIIFASDYMDELYSYAEKLIDEGKAYVCSCTSEEISEQRRNMKDSPHRDNLVEDNKGGWKLMKKGEREDLVLRLKIDMKHKNAVMRDPVIFRVIKKNHYRQGKKYKAWPMYDFETTVVDGINNITHVLRSNEFDSRIELHHHIADILGFSEIPYKHYGRINITGSLTKGREIRSKIEEGEYIGWDDPRLVTLRALRRRGIVKESIMNIVKMCGLSKQNTNIDFSVIAAENRKILDAKAKRFFFIAEPENIIIEGSEKTEIRLSTHPDEKSKDRKFEIDDAFVIDKKDKEKIRDGKIIRLMDCLNFTKEGKDFKFYSSDYKDYKADGDKIIHWLPEKETLDAEIVMPDGNKISGLAEKNIEKLDEGDVIQFERFGFCRLDEKKKGRYVFWYTHD